MFFKRVTCILRVRVTVFFINMDQLQREYLRGARRKAQATDYFDAEESDDDRERAPRAAAEEEEVDPLDAFMQGIDAQVTQLRKAPPKRVADKPQVLNHAGDGADNYLEEYARVRTKFKIICNCYVAILY